MERFDWARPSTLLALLLVGPPAGAATYHFVQSGFAEAAVLSGSFAGSDSNGDGVLSVDIEPGTLEADGSPFIVLNELAAFSLHFSGNAAVSAFDLGLTDILHTQFGIPCCGDAQSYEFYFDLAHVGHLEFVAMSTDHIALVLRDEPFGNFSAVGQECAFTGGSGNCGHSSGAPYSPRVSAVPIPSPLLLWSSALLPLVARTRRHRPRLADHWSKS